MLNLGIPIDKALLETILMREETEIIEARIWWRDARIKELIATNASLATISALRLANEIDNAILLEREKRAKKGRQDA